MRRLVSSESVTEGHPDKAADHVSHAMLNAALGTGPRCRRLLRQADDRRVGIGRRRGLGAVWLAARRRRLGVARRTLRKVGSADDHHGIDADTCSLLVAPARPVDGSGSGDPKVYGFATNEHTTRLPQPIPHALARHLVDVHRLDGSPFAPGGMAMATAEYDGHVPRRVASVVISTHHDADANCDDVASALAEGVLALVLYGCELVVDASGSVVLGGAQGDCRFTARQIIVETYGGVGCHSCGTFSGRDPSKVARSAAYACRWVAKNLLAAGALARSDVQVDYEAGRAVPPLGAPRTDRRPRLADGCRVMTERHTEEVGR